MSRHGEDNGRAIELRSNGAEGDDARVDAAKSASSTDEAEDESQYPGTLVTALLTFGLCLAAFTTALDNTIIATAIPKITSVFDSLDDVGWYGSAYLLTTTALQPTFGKIYTFFNVKWTYLSALIIFEVGSVICAASKTSVIFIVGRAIAGIGGAALFSGGMTMVALVTPIRRRAMYNSILTSMFGIASVVGPLLGGAFTDKLSWRWCFWINLPFGAVAFMAVLLIFRMPERPHTNLTVKEKLLKLDLLGGFLFVPAIVCLLLALQWGGITYSWKDSRVWGCILGFVLIIACFVGSQIYRGEDATIPPRIMKQRTVLSSTLFIAFLSMGVYAHFYYLPFYFQAVKGTSAMASGIRTVPYIVSITVAAVIVGVSLTFIGYYTPFTWFGASAFTVGAGLMYTLQVETTSSRWIGYQVLTGFGAGIALEIPFIAVQRVVAKKDMPVGNAMVGFFNSLGSGISISVAENIFSNTLVKGLEQDVHGINPEVVVAAGATGVRDVTPPQLLPAVLHAYNNAITTAFIFSIASGGFAVLCSMFIEWKSVKGTKPEQAEST
ncbi:MFS general substrate transporter [Neofusicoccum parvum]|nr:MFS general substrate transporter [Neofusicoccum parvum]